MNYTDTQLKQALMKMLSEQIYWNKKEQCYYWFGQEPPLTSSPVLDTELLHLCWLVEQTLTEDGQQTYKIAILVNGYWMSIHATWQQRVIALANVKGVEIV